MKTINLFRVFVLTVATLMAGISCSFANDKSSVVEGNGEVITKSFQVDNFKGVSVGGFSNGYGVSFKEVLQIISHNKRTTNGAATPTFYYKQGASSTLSITTDKNIMPLLAVKAKDGKLSVTADQAIAPTKMEMRGSSEVLSSVEVQGGGTFILDSPLTGDELEMSIQGGGDLFFEPNVTLHECEMNVSGGGTVKIAKLQCSEVEANIAGGGTITLAGTAEEGEFNVSGGGDLFGYDMQIKKVECNVAGGGTAKVYASDTIKGQVTGGGDLYYKGDPAKAKTSTAGGGEVHKVK